MSTLSVAIITRNEAHRIADCLRSVSFADQIVVLDSGSTDGTVAIARDLGAEVQITDWPGFGPQKNRALAACRHPWVLSIDADERVSDELRDAILAAIARDPEEAGVVGFRLPRLSTFRGQPMYHGLWGNDRVLRLFARSKARFTDDRVHERVICDGPVGDLSGYLLHDSVDSLTDAWEKARRYAALGAEGLRERGKGGVLAAWVHGIWAFVRGYGLRAGFLDGRNGLLLAWIGARGSYWKYRWAVGPGNPVTPAAAERPESRERSESR